MMCPGLTWSWVAQQAGNTRDDNSCRRGYRLLQRKCQNNCQKNRWTPEEHFALLATVDEMGLATIPAKQWDWDKICASMRRKSVRRDKNQIKKVWTGCVIGLTVDGLVDITFFGSVHQ